jgi:acetyl esterase/lipase
MTLQLDPEVQAALAPMMAAMASMPKLAAGDIEGRRASFPSMLEAMFGALPIPTDVTTKDYHTTTTDGHSLLLRWISKTPSAAGTPTPAVVYAHGGGELCSFQDRLLL